MRNIIGIPLKLERYNIKSRAAAIGLPLQMLLAEANRRTGRRMRRSEFAAARAGRDRTDSAEQTLEAADKILTELERRKPDAKNVE